MQAVLPSIDPPSGSGEGRAQAWAVLDDPAEWPSFGRCLDDDALHGRWESQVAVDGMRCAACAFAIEAALAGVPGVEEAQVNAVTQRARIVWSAAAGRPSGWFAAAQAAGYGFVPLGAVATRARRQQAERVALWRWMVAGFCMMQVMMYAYPAYIATPGEVDAGSAQLMRWASWVLSLPVLLFSCAPFFASAWRDLARRRLGMDLPVALGMGITFAVSTAATFDAGGALGHEVYFDSFTMFVFLLLTGRWLEERLRGRTAGALDALIHRLPDSVLRADASGRFQRVAVGRLAVGDLVRVLPGEAFPADGVVETGATHADEALLTGESRPVSRGPGDPVLSGSHNLDATVEVRVRGVGQSTRFARVVALMEATATAKPRLALLADRIARPFLVGVLAAAAAALAWWWPVDHGKALMAAVAVLVVTCPCALSLASPAAMLASAASLARRGVLVGRLQGLEALAGVDTVVFDKTGTLTDDTPRLERVFCRAGARTDDVLALAAAIGAQSSHPAARALVAAWGGGAKPGWQVMRLVEHGGQGLAAEVSLQPSASIASGAVPMHVRLGAAAFCGAVALRTKAVQVHLCDDAGWLASFELGESLRPDVVAAVYALRAQGIEVRLLSGDQPEAANALAERAGITHAQGGCTPEDKLQALLALQASGRRVAMVGDGLNDGPVLARANASFAFGRAVPLAQAGADFSALGGEVMAIVHTIGQARRTMRVVRQNLYWAAAYNAVCVPLALGGLLPAWLAGAGMAASSLVVVANAARLSGRHLPTT
ncbi:copper-translocating P-type ATPase [Rhodoferax koreense]|uniref:Copper-translocating P-type ATPase n=1 Tax=Rhodoferax koreensis TaxID=1842727 RepID=A0A1P8JU67_9BURK|nr:cation-translocating P-type ATPase [Rhodoferax koreense]APW37275.1 copper-translocating P-type ATPase [Rhodoferax koreense]